MQTANLPPKERNAINGQCERCGINRTVGERLNGRGMCYECSVQDRQERDIKYHQAMLDRHEAYTGTGRCSLSCAICIQEGRKL